MNLIVLIQAGGSGIGWVVSVSLLGYFCGQIPFVKQHIEKAIMLILLLSVAPVAQHAWMARRRRVPA